MSGNPEESDGLQACNTYEGFVDGDPSLISRLTINDDQMKGFFKTKDDFIVIESLSRFIKGNNRKTYFVAFRQSDVKPNEAECGITSIMESQYLKKIRQELCS